jgi:hypothetical protein
MMRLNIVRPWGPAKLMEISALHIHIQRMLLKMILAVIFLKQIVKVLLIV